MQNNDMETSINSFVLGNPHESIFPAIYGAAEIKDVSALGIIESYDASSIIVQRMKLQKQQSLI